MRSTSYFFAAASTSVRWSTLSVPARQMLTLTPYFASKGLISVGWSFSAKVVYIVSVPSFFAAATIFSIRSGPL